jgi:hypothetical protein
MARSFSKHVGRVAPVAHTTAKRAKTSPACVFCADCADETAEHFALECPAFQELRQEQLAATRDLVGEPKFGTWSQLPLKARLRALLGTQWWGKHAGTGDEWIQTYLLHLEQERASLAAGAAGEQQHEAADDLFRTLPASDGARAHSLGYG